MKLRIANLGREFDVIPGRPLLDTALAAGVNIPFGCRGGNCGSCVARLVEGEYSYPHGAPLGLAGEQDGDGQVLLCQAHARSDVAVEFVPPAAAADIVVKRLPARIESCEPLAHDVLRVMLRIPVAEEFNFQAGQYLDVLLPGGRRRSFSIASAPGSAPLLELHIRRAVGGEFTEALFAGALPTSLLSIEGPLGRFFYHESEEPMLLIAGGTGLAPLDSIMRHVMGRGLKRRMRLFWGCREARDLYADARLRGYVRDGALEDYVPVLSESPDTAGTESALVHEAVLREVTDLHRYHVYAAGPPGMINAIEREFHGRGARQIFVDSFDYAPDTLARQRSAAATRS